MIGYFEKDKLISIGKYFPAYLISIGSLKLIVFYKSFNIRIVEYIDFTEVLISFFDSVIFYTSVFILPMLLFWGFWGKSVGKANAETFEREVQFNFYQRIKNDFKRNKFGFIFGIIILGSTIFLIFWGKWDENTIASFIMFPGLYISYFIIRELQFAYKQQYDYSIPPTYFNTFLLLYLMTSYIMSDTLKEATEIKHGYKFYGTEIQFDNETIKSDSIVTYVGQTRNYIFFYDLHNKESIIYPKNKLIKIKLTKK